MATHHTTLHPAPCRPRGRGCGVRTTQPQHQQEVGEGGGQRSLCCRARPSAGYGRMEQCRMQPCLRPLGGSWWAGYGCRPYVAICCSSPMLSQAVLSASTISCGKEFHKLTVHHAKKVLSRVSFKSISRSFQQAPHYSSFLGFGE